MRLLESVHSRVAKRASYAALLAAMLLSVFLGPIVQETDLESGWIASLLFVLVLASCLAAALEESRWFGLLFLAVIGIEIGMSFLIRSEAVPAFAGHRAMRAIVLTLTAWILLRDLMRQRRVTVDTVLGAICVYLLIGLVFTEAYLVVERLFPGSFAGSGVSSDTQWDVERAYLASEYFSFVTMTTLGYGDIAPVRALARSLAIVQAIAGQFYIAVIVARVVSLYVVNLHVTSGGEARADATSEEADD